jgi:tetratricopeptide (TPR) repeat protein
VTLKLSWPTSAVLPEKPCFFVSIPSSSSVMDADSLVQQATDLARRGHLDEARDLLRKAAGMAPLRADIREMLLDINDHAGSAPRTRKSAPNAQPPTPASRPPTASPFARMGGSSQQAPPPPLSENRISHRPGEFYVPPRGASSFSWVLLWIGVAVLLVGIAFGAVYVFKMLPVPGSKPGDIIPGTTMPVKSATPKDPLEAKRLELKTEVKALMQENKYDDALKTLDQLVAETKPPKMEEYDALRFESHIESGKAKRQRKEYKSALSDFDAAVKLNPNDSGALFYLGYMHYQVGLMQNDKKTSKASYQEAEKYLNKAIAADPKNFKAYESLGHTYFKDGKDIEGVEKFKKIIELSPDSPEAKTAQDILKTRGVR